MLAVDPAPKLLELLLGEVVRERVLRHLFLGPANHAIEGMGVIDAPHQGFDRLGMRLIRYVLRQH